MTSEIPKVGEAEPASNGYEAVVRRAILNAQQRPDTPLDGEFIKVYTVPYSGDETDAISVHRPPISQFMLNMLP